MRAVRQRVEETKTVQAPKGQIALRMDKAIMANQAAEDKIEVIIQEVQALRDLEIRSNIVLI